MRCIALAQKARTDGWRPIFTLASGSESIEPRLHQEGFLTERVTGVPGGAEDAGQTIDLAHKHRAAHLVVDGYRFGSDFQKSIKDAGFRLLAVDDYGHADHYWADLVLNQNVYAEEEPYRNREAYTRLLLGCRFALLRREFLADARPSPRLTVRAERILVTLGGADPDNATHKVVQALAGVKSRPVQAVVVVGASNPNWATLEQAARSASVPVRLERSVTNMPELMAWAQVAVSAGGSTCWELAYMGLPNLTLVLAENQKPIAEALHERGVAENLGWHNDVTTERIAEALETLLGDGRQREMMSQAGRKLVDGKGAERVATEFLRPQGALG